MFSAISIENRSIMEARTEQIKQHVLANSGQATCLSLGCGARIWPGFVSVDKYYIHPQVQNYDMFKLPYENESVDLIFSSHSLEHLPIRHSIMAINEWGRVLKNHGELFLAIPDLKEIMKIMLRDDVAENMKLDWFMYTLFGYQADCNIGNPPLDTPIDPGQFHTSGFTDSTITKFLSQAGLTVTDIYTYEGYRTPSLWVEAKKIN